MVTAVFAFVLMVIVVAAMAIGVLFGRAPIAGSCGGLKNLGIAGECEICGGNTQLCETNTQEPNSTAVTQQESIQPVSKQKTRTPFYQA